MYCIIRRHQSGNKTDDWQRRSGMRERDADSELPITLYAYHFCNTHYTCIMRYCSLIVCRIHCCQHNIYLGLNTLLIHFWSQPAQINQSTSGAEKERAERRASFLARPPLSSCDRSNRPLFLSIPQVLDAILAVILHECTL